MDDKEQKLINDANEWIGQAKESLKQSKGEFGDKWILSDKRSVEMWLRGYNANERNNKVFNVAMELIKSIQN